MEVVTLGKPPRRQYPHSITRAVMIAVMLSVSSHGAAQIEWTGANGDDWFDAGNWNPVEVPTDEDTVRVNDGSAGVQDADSNGNAQSADLWVGTVGGQAGMLTIDNGGVLSSDGIARVGFSDGSTGRITVEGLDSVWTLSSTMIVGGGGSTGTLGISGGGTVSNGSAAIGLGAGSTGTATVAGAGSSWTNDGLLDVGWVGEGTLFIEEGAEVTSGFVNIGRSAGTGSVTVDGISTTWTLSGDLSLGAGVDDGGDGSLSISGGGAVSNNNGIVGREVGGVGEVTVDGAGSIWNNSGLIVGDEGDGALAIINGGAVDAVFSSHIGFDSGSTGAVMVDGAGSSWNADTLYVGSNGTGVVTVRGGAAVTASPLTIASNVGSIGTVNIGDGGVPGILDMSTVTGGDGDATLNFNHGDDNYFFTADGTAGGAAIDITGSVTVNHTGLGTTTLTGANTYTGGTNVDAGTLLIAGSLGDTTVNVAGGATFGGTGSTDGDVIVVDGATVAPGRGGIGELETGPMSLSGASILEFELATPGIVAGTNDSIVIDGDLHLDGKLRVTDAGGFGEGVYRMFIYSGALADNTLEVDELPAGFSAVIDHAVINVATPGTRGTVGAVRLVVMPLDAIFDDAFE